MSSFLHPDPEFWPTLLRIDWPQSKTFSSLLSNHTTLVFFTWFLLALFLPLYKRKTLFFALPLKHLLTLWSEHSPYCNIHPTPPPFKWCFSLLGPNLFLFGRRHKTDDPEISILPFSHMLSKTGVRFLSLPHINSEIYVKFYPLYVTVSSFKNINKTRISLIGFGGLLSEKMQGEHLPHNLHTIIIHKC